MKREIKILIETDSTLVEEGFVRVAVTELDDKYHLHSLSKLHGVAASGWNARPEYLHEEIASQVFDFLQAEKLKVAWSH